MLTSGSDFPKEDLLSSLRNDLKGKDQFLQEANKLNIQWIYEIVKYCHNVLFEVKEVPQTKLNALLLVKDLLESAQVPTVHLIEIYIIPAIYEFAIYKHQDKADVRGNFFFHNNGYSPKIPNLVELGKNFIKLSSELLYIASLIKPRRTFETEQLNQPSISTEHYQKFSKLGIDGSPKNQQGLSFFKERSIQNSCQKYLKKLKSFDKHSEDYSIFFVCKMVESLQTQQNPLFSSTGKTVTSINSDLDMKKILKHGDTYITTDLLQEIIQGFKTSQNLLVKRNFLSLLSDFVKWADLEAFVNICYDDGLDKIIPRIAEVNGQKGLGQGQKIFPQIKGQREAKKKFYIEFLKSLEVWSKCIPKDLQDEEEDSKVKQFYTFFKVDRKFIFPDNLMSKKIEEDFLKCLEYNTQRNQRILAKLRVDETSLYNSKKSSSINKAALAKSSHVASRQTKRISFEFLSDKFDNCFQNFVSLCDDERQVNSKMKKLLEFKDTFDSDLNDVDDNQIDRPFEQFEELIDNGDELIERIKIVEEIYNEYKKKKINFQEFREQFELVLEDMEEDDQEDDEESSNNFSSRNDPSSSVSQASIKNTLKDSGKMFKSSSRGRPNLRNSGFSRASNKNVSEKDSSLSISKKLKLKKSSPTKKSNTKLGGSRVKQPGEEFEQNIEVSSVEPHPYFAEPSQAKGNGISKLSKLKSKSIYSSGRSGLKEKLKNRKSEVSDKGNHSNLSPIPESKPRPKGRESCEQYMMRPQPQIVQKQTFKQKLLIHRDSRISKNSKCSISHHSIAKNKRLQQSTRNVHYERRQIFEQSNNNESLGLSEQLNQIQNLNSISETSIQKQTPSKSRRSSKLRASNVSRKNDIKDRIKKSSVNIKGGRPSSRSSRRSSQSGREDYGYYGSGSAAKVDTNQYMMIPQKNDCQAQSSKSIGVNQFALKRPISSRFKSKLDDSQSQASENYPYNRPQTSAGNAPKPEHFADHYQMRASVYEDDQIKDPGTLPIENSYYGIQEIQAKAKKSAKLQFKNCFRSNQVIPTEGRKPMVLKGINSDQGLLRRGRSTNQSSIEDMNINKNPQEEYLMMKMKKDLGREENSQLKKIQGRILKLKTQTSKIRSDFSSRSQENRQFSLSRRSHSGASSRDLCSFSSSKNSKNSSYRSLSREKSNVSKGSNISVEGKFLNMKTFQRYLSEIKDQNVKRTFLRHKIIILKNQLIEVGCLFRRERYNLKIMIFLTPEVDISNLSMTVSKQYNIETQIFPQTFPEIPATKQVKATLQIQLKNSPFNIPVMTIGFDTARQHKNYNVYVPCPLHKFIEFHSIRDRHELINRFSNPDENVIQTGQFRVSRRVGKIDHLTDYFPRLTTVSMGGEKVKYAAECTFKRQRFLLMFTVRKPASMVIQGIPLSRPQFLEYLIGSLKHIFTMER